jgi:glycosyltransferase involved in cell wall biosynthesis
MDKKEQPLVSVIVNCYNGEKYLQEAIDSVYAQTYKNWEIVFWDNASTDRSAEIAKSYESKIKYFKCDTNISLGKARNKAIEKCNGDLIAFLDTDDIWAPEKLVKQISEFCNKDIVLNFTNTKYINDDGVKYNLYKKSKVFNINLFPRLLESNIICLSSVMILSEAVKQLSELFDDTLMVSEEYDLFLRLAYGKRCSYINGNPLTIYRMHNESLTYNNKLLFPEENKLILNKLIKMYPEISIKYKKAIRKNIANIEFLYAMGEFRLNNRISSRRRLFPHLKTNKKFIIPYFFTFTDFKYFEFFLKLVNKQHLI